MVEWGRLFGKGDKDPLPALLLEALPREWPELHFTFHPIDDSVEIRADGETVLMMSLASVRERARSGTAEGVAAWLKDKQVRRALDQAAGRGVEQPKFDALGLVPRFAPESRLASVPTVPAHRAAWPGVWLTVCWHHEDFGAHYLADDQLSDLGLDWDTGLERAIANLDGLWRGKLEVLSVPAPDGSSALLVLQNTHAASGLLLPALRAKLAQQLGSPFLAMAPQPDELVFAPATPRARADELFETTLEHFRESAHPVSDRVLLVRPEGFAPERP
jgi:hypothetical protein